MKDTRLLDIFNQVRETLCRKDYYIHTSKKILHVTNTEDMIPHLMGLQYIARKEMFAGNKGVYMIKKERLRYSSIEKLIRKYYRKKEKQNSMIAMVRGKIEHLACIKDMLSSYSMLYLYDVEQNPEMELKTDYLFVNQQDELILQLGLIKPEHNWMKVYHCNSFMVDYKENKDYDLHYRNLTHKYEINKIVMEDKITKEKEVIYQSDKAIKREKEGIRKMLVANEITPNEELIDNILKLNMRSGQYNTMEMLKKKLDVFS